MELYVHIPFCVKKCAYCDFLSFPQGEEIQRRYVEKLLEAKEEDLNLVMTGKVFPEKLKPYVDAISRIEYIQDLQD